MTDQDWADKAAGKRDFIVSLITHDFFPRMTTLEREVWLNNNKKYIDDKVAALDSLIPSSTPDYARLVEKCNRLVAYLDRHYTGYGTVESAKVLIGHIEELRAALSDVKPKVCEWVDKRDDGAYFADCGLENFFLDSTPEECGFTYCPHCGSPIKVKE